MNKDSIGFVQIMFVAAFFSFVLAAQYHMESVVTNALLIQGKITEVGWFVRFDPLNWLFFVIAGMVMLFFPIDMLRHTLKRNPDLVGSGRILFSVLFGALSAVTLPLAMHQFVQTEIGRKGTLPDDIVQLLPPATMSMDTVLTTVIIGLTSFALFLLTLGFFGKERLVTNNNNLAQRPS